MNFSPSIMLAWLLALVAVHPVLAEGELSITADTPTAVVTPRSAERAPLILPELEYNFRISASCHDDFEATSISLAVADTRRSFNRTQIAAGELDAVSFRIPSNQIAPVVIANFCVASTDEDGAMTSTEPKLSLTIRSALSAQASLLCVSEGNQSMKYASASLDIQLQCTDISNKSGPAVGQ